jgi:magnesium chelatase subunit I
MSHQNITTLGELKKTNYQPKSVKEELRINLTQKLKNKEVIFPGIIGFDDTVLPDVERAILSKHNMLLLGLRGQAKTRIARLLTNLLDEYIPYITGSEINDDPMQPISKQGKEAIAEHGDATPISWMHRDERYVEKLATPDVSVADLIGDVDPIKAASLKLPYSDERVLHFGLVPRSNRCIFVINELPDLQARIQVSLFNLLQEGDLQIRGFKVRMPVDVEFVFTANPEDYTNRGSIVTPLKDRIQSQILTHYPKTAAISKQITTSEAKLHQDQKSKIFIPNLHRDLLEQFVIEARNSEFTDEKSGVSARMSISALENLVSTAERRMLISGDQNTTTRITDFWGVIPAITGKIELVYEGEQEGIYNVAMKLLDRAIKEQFKLYFPDPEKSRAKDPFGTIKMWFKGNALELLLEASEKSFKEELSKVSGLRKLLDDFNISANEDIYPFMEFVIHGLNSYEVVQRDYMEKTLTFEDPLGALMKDDDDDDR